MPEPVRISAGRRIGRPRLSGPMPTGANPAAASRSDQDQAGRAPVAPNLVAVPPQIATPAGRAEPGADLPRRYPPHRLEFPRHAPPPGRLEYFPRAGKETPSPAPGAAW